MPAYLCMLHLPPPTTASLLAPSAMHTCACRLPPRLYQQLTPGASPSSSLYLRTQALLRTLRLAPFPVAHRRADGALEA